MKSEIILWADDEIDLLKPHVLFLRQKGYEVVTVTNGRDALDKVEAGHFDLIILDENMPGLSGLETLSRIKELAPQTPVVMITKSEEEDIMNQAIGNKIADYLIKPVNPNQILLSIKKISIGKRLFRKKRQAVTSRISIASMSRSTILFRGKTGMMCIVGWYIGNWNWNRPRGISKKCS